MLKTKQKGFWIHNPFGRGQQLFREADVEFDVDDDDNVGKYIQYISLW